MTYDLNSFANIKDDPIDADSMTGYVNSIIPHDTYEDYATDILEEYATNNKTKTRSSYTRRLLARFKRR